MSGHSNLMAATALRVHSAGTGRPLTPCPGREATAGIIRSFTVTAYIRVAHGWGTVHCYFHLYRNNCIHNLYGKYKVLVVSLWLPRLLHNNATQLEHVSIFLKTQSIFWRIEFSISHLTKCPIMLAVNDRCISKGRAQLKRDCVVILCFYVYLWFYALKSFFFRYILFKCILTLLKQDGLIFDNLKYSRGKMDLILKTQWKLLAGETTCKSEFHTWIINLNMYILSF